MANVYYELNEDFKKVYSIFIDEKLTEDEISEGLEAMNFEIKVCFTTHAIERCNDELEREVDPAEVVSLFLKAGSSLLNIKNGVDFTVASRDKTFAVMGVMHYQDGNPHLIIKTAVRVWLEDEGRYKTLYIKNQKEAIFVSFED